MRAPVRRRSSATIANDDATPDLNDHTDFGDIAFYDRASEKLEEYAKK